MKEPIGLVLSGGGGKGAYEIGVWKYLEEVKEEWKITAVSGTSVGALNAALYSCLNYQEAENIWKNLKEEDILTKNEKSKWEAPMLIAEIVTLFSKSMLPHVLILSAIQDYYLNDNAFFSRSGIKRIMKENNIPLKLMSAKIPCYSTCYNLTRMRTESFLLNQQDADSIQNILLSTTAIPFIFPNENINGEKDYSIERKLVHNIPLFQSKIEKFMNMDRYCDGGIPFVGDNVPIAPLYKIGYRKFLVVHLQEKRENKIVEKIEKFPNSIIIDLYPSEKSLTVLKSGVKGLLDFENNQEKISAGYEDAKNILSNITEEFYT